MTVSSEEAIRNAPHLLVCSDMPHEGYVLARTQKNMDLGHPLFAHAVGEAVPTTYSHPTDGTEADTTSQTVDTAACRSNREVVLLSER